MSAHDDLINLIRREAAMVARRHMPGHRFGLVAQYNPTTHQVRVTFPDDLDSAGNPTLSPWMPIIAPNASAGAGQIVAPLMGSQALIIHFGYGADKFSFMLGVVRSSQDPVPASGAPEGEFWIYHPSGTYFKMTKPGEFQTGGGTWNHTGDLNVTGSVNAGGNAGAGAGCDGSFTTPTGQIVTVKKGVITNIN